MFKSQRPLLVEDCLECARICHVKSVLLISTPHLEQANVERDVLNTLLPSLTKFYLMVVEIIDRVPSGVMTERLVSSVVKQFFLDRLSDLSCAFSALIWCFMQTLKTREINRRKKMLIFDRELVVGLTTNFLGPMSTINEFN